MTTNSRNNKKAARAVKAMTKGTIVKRAILSVVALLVLLGAAVYLTLGWYTKMTGIATTEFHTARWDFTANYQIDSFEVNVYEYDTPSGHNIAAPGTAGTIDLRLGADDSDTDVHYLVQIDKGTMSEDFRKRIYFYYLDENNEKQEFIYGLSSVEGVIPAHGNTVVTLYWEWVYNYSEYLEKTSEDPFKNAAYELSSYLADDYDKIGFDYDPISEIVKTIDSVPAGKRAMLESLYKTEKLNYTTTEALLIDILGEAKKQFDYSIYPSYYPLHRDITYDGCVNNFSCLTTNSEPLSTYCNNAYLLYAYSAEKAESAFDVLVTDNYFNLSLAQRNACADYLFGQHVKTVGLDYAQTGPYPNNYLIVLKADETLTGTVAGATAPEDGDADLACALFHLLSLGESETVETVFGMLDECRQRVGVIDEKYKKAVGSGANKVLSSAMAKIKAARSSSDLDSALEGFRESLTDENTATPYQYLKTYSDYFGYDSVTAMVNEMAREIRIFDNYDSKVGGNPQYYKQFMSAKVYVVGEQIKPEVISK